MIQELHIYKYLTEGDLNHTYSPLLNIKSEDGTIGEFTVNRKLNWSLNYPIHIECQPSYDGTVNLIINDDKNPPRIINTRFSKIEDNRFKIINRNQASQSNIYNINNIDLETRLFRTSNEFPVLDLIKVEHAGRLKGGNYTFYIKLADSDENETDVVCESGIISIFNGSTNVIGSITGTLANQETDKSVTLTMSHIDTSFPKFYVYYSRETSDLSGTRIVEFGKLTNPYDIKGSSQKLIIYGHESVEFISEDDLNIKYLHVSAAKTQAQIQNMLFLGNVQEEEVKHTSLQNLSYYIEVTLKQKSESIGWISPATYSANQYGSEYYDPKNIYYNLGYWPGELYRLGIVYIMNDDSLTPVFNLRGCIFNTIGSSNLSESMKSNMENLIPANSFLSADIVYSNSMGVFKNPSETNETKILNFDNYETKPWYYEMNFELVSSQLKNLGVKGFFIVRQKRIPTTLCQGLSIGVEKLSGLPCLYNNLDKKYIAESFISQSKMLQSNILQVDSDKLSSSGLLCVEAEIIPETRAKFNGSEMILEKTASCNSQIIRNHYVYNLMNSEFDSKAVPCVFVKENTPYKYTSGYGFSTRAGSELTVKEFAQFGLKTNTDLIRGIFTSFIGVCGLIDPNCIYNVKIPNYSEHNMSDYMTVRSNDNSPFYAVSNRYSIDSVKSINVFRGDCFTTTVTSRINRNFTDPDTPINDVIVDKTCWTNYKGVDETTAEDWGKINRADVNAVQLGLWASYKCLSTYNLGLRSEDDSDLSEVTLFGVPKSFYPHRSIDTRSAFKISESTILNNGLSSTVGRRWNGIVQNVPYIKNNYDSRIMFSNVFTEDNFRNGYRIFQGLSYKDIDRQYGAIVKLIPWGTNLFCVFEHGLGIIPINEKALIQTSTNQSIHMYGAGVIQNQISLVSPDFGSIWQESIIRTPLALYGVDTNAKKIWRFSDTKGLEIISDMKIQRFLNEHLKLNESDKYPTISIKNVKSHYNNYKGDVMFTFYNDREEEVWNFCFNERMSKWITRYSWTPLYSENIDNIFYSLDQNRTKVLAYIYNNRNCTYGLRCDNNILVSNPTINVYNLKFEGSIVEPTSYEIESVKIKYVVSESDQEVVINSSDIDGIQITSHDLLINYSTFTSWFENKYNAIPIHLFIKINCVFDGYSRQDILGIINQSHPNWETYSVNGFYVHGRAGIFNELNYSDADYTNQILPTKWYDKQEPFEFEFVVNGDVGFHKIFDNLIIISNNVQPKQFEFSIIGDVYNFNKSGIFRSDTFNENEWNTAKVRKHLDSDNKLIDYKVSQTFENCQVVWDNNQNNYWLKLSQETKNIKDFGRLKGNIHYKEDSWYVTIDPIKYKNKYLINNEVLCGNSAQNTRVRDKFMKIRVKYSGEDLVIITALNTLLTISYS